ncbi:MAG: NADH-quinone oxidoreductase subunit H [Thermoplasmata archaeon]|nr:NADH-quinone oxidoreductase subunit H [Thermoplasmata archaeon]
MLDIPYEVEILLRSTVGAIAVALFALIFGLILVGIDRKVHARMQSRIGPPIRQPFRDVKKLLYKQTIIPENAVQSIYNNAPILAFAAAMAVMVYLPLGPFSPMLSEGGDLILVLYLLIIPSLAMVVGGFASGSPYATVGAQREMVLMISYELPLASVIIAIAWKAASGGLDFAAFTFSGIMSYPIWDHVGAVGAVGAILLLGTILITLPGEMSKIPFDAPEAETEICGGLLAEYSGRNLAMFMLADAVKTVALGTLVIALFFPWGLTPTLESVLDVDINKYIGWGIDFLFYMLKLILLVVVAVSFPRTAFSRIKVDQITDVYWKRVGAMALVGVFLLMLDLQVL